MGLLQTEVFLDVFCEGIVYFGVTFNRLLLASGGIQVDVMPGAVPVEYATRFSQLPDQFGTFQSEISFIS